jgi:hypothetical protein
MEQENTIILETVITKINQLGKENDKNDFISNFNEVKNTIIKIEDILEKPNDISPETPLNKLFELLSEFDGLLDKSDLDIKTFKKIKNIVELIEKKLEESKVNLIEIK